MTKTFDLIYFISGMWCTTCAKSINEKLQSIEGVRNTEINYSTKLLTVNIHKDYNEETLDQIIQKAVTKVGFGIKKQSHGWILQFQEELKNEANQKISWMQIFILWFLAMWSSMFALTSYLGEIPSEHLYYLTIASAVFGLPAVVMGIIPYAQSGVRALFFSKLITIDFFIFAGGIASLLVSVTSLMRGEATSYLDSSAMILAILLTSKKIENSLSVKITSKILFQLTPVKKSIQVLKKEQWRNAEVTQIKVGDLVSIEPQETIPLDGILQSNTCSINNHLMTGENHRIELKKGDNVYAGAITYDKIIIKVTSSQGQRKIDEWAEKAILAENSKGSFQALLKRIEKNLVLLAFSGAFLIAIIHTLKGNPLSSIIESFFVGLLIFCPCLFASIIPLTKQLAHLTLLNVGVLGSRVEALFDLTKIQFFSFDKTGTLEAVESEFHSFEKDNQELEDILGELASHSKHIILRNFSKTSSNNQIENVHEIAGKGLIAQTKSNDKIIVGSKSFLEENNISIPHHLNKNYSFVAINQRLVGEIIKKSNYDENAQKILRKILDFNPKLQIDILSGDPELKASHKYSSIDKRIHYYGGLSPEEKAKKINPSSAFIGDGLNDTLALSEALVSFRIGQRVMSLDSVDFYLQRPDLNLIIVILNYAKKYKKILIQTSIAALIYNIIAISFAAYTTFSPLSAVSAMFVSFLLMLLSILRLTKIN